jgi:hypothetical protein
MKYIVFLALIFIATQSCRRQAKKEQTEIYPISAILQENSKKVDSAYQSFTYLVTENSITDSTTVDNAFFNSFAKAFFTIDLTNNKFNKYYKENNFQDQSNGANGTATFTYEAIDNKAPYQTMQIAMDRGTQTYKYAFLTQFERSKDTVISKKLSWFFNKNAIIVRTFSLNGATFKTITEKLIWAKQ